MPKAIESKMRGTMTSSSIHEVKKDISIDLGKPDGPGSGLSGDVVKLPPNQVFRPKLFQPVVPDSDHEIADYPKATPRPQKPRERKPIDGGKRTLSAKDIDFKVPPKPVSEAHHDMITTELTTFFTGGATGAVTAAVMIGASIGGSAGSVVPIVGTAVGIVVGAVAGAVIGHLIGKFRRSRTEHRYFNNAIKSLENQGVKFTEKEKERLQSLSPEQWVYLTKDNGQTIKALKKYSSPVFGDRRWAKQFYYQYAIMAVAKHGLKGAQRYVANAQLRAKDEEHRPVVAASAMLAQMEAWGADTLYIQSVAEGKDLEDLRSVEKRAWKKLAGDVKQAFGQPGLEHFINRNLRYAERATRAYFVRKNVDAAIAMRTHLTRYLEPYLHSYDQDTKTRVGKLVRDYALDLAVGDVPRASFYDAHGNFDQELIAELINTAASLHEAKERFKKTPVDSVRPEVLIRKATLPNRISGYVAATGRGSIETYNRFIDEAATNIYDECEQLLTIKEEDLSRMLWPGRSAPGAPAPVDVLAQCQAQNLLRIAELASRLKSKGVGQEMGRMILRMAAQGCFGLEEAFYKQNKRKDGSDVRYATVKVGAMVTGSGWPTHMSDNPAADLPKDEILRRASRFAADASRLHTELLGDPDLRHLTEADAENIYFSFASQHSQAGYDDEGSLDKMRQNKFWMSRQILKAGVRGHLVYQALGRGARTLEEAIECARLLVDAKQMRSILSEISLAELRAWKHKGFSDVEIAAYRNNLMDWRFLSAPPRKMSTAAPKRLYNYGTLGIQNKEIDAFQGSGIPADEANDLLKLGLAPKGPNLPALKPRHVDATTHVLSDRIGGEGSQSQVRIRTIRQKDGTIDRRVFKQAATDNEYKWNMMTRQEIGSNLAASMVDKALGFDVIVDTQLSTRNGLPGLSMELAKGHQANKLQSGEAFVPVPEDEPRYADLHKRVREDMTVLGAISDETRTYAADKLKLTRLRMAGNELQAAGDFMDDLINDPATQECLVSAQIDDFVNAERDRHLNNLIFDVRLGPKGATAAGIKGIDNDGGFASSGILFTNSVQTMPRVMSRRQADAIINMYENRNENDGILAKLKKVVVPSDIKVPVGPAASFPFKNAHAATAAHLPPPENGDQVAQFEERLKLLYDRVIDAQNGKWVIESDDFPTLTIISGTAPDSDVKDDIGDDRTKNDFKAAWGSELVTKILTNTSSIVARLKIQQN